MPTSPTTQAYQINDIAAMFEEDVPTTRQPQLNDGADAVTSIVEEQEPQPARAAGLDDGTFTVGFEEVSSVAPTQTPQISDGSDTIQIPYYYYEF